MILNLTQHPATDAQLQDGVVDLQGEAIELLKALLTFNKLPSIDAIDRRAEEIAELACYNGLGGEDDDPWPSACMIGGAPFLMHALHERLQDRGIEVLYAFSARESVEEKTSDGAVIKKNIFRHKGFVGKK